MRDEDIDDIQTQAFYDNGEVCQEEREMEIVESDQWNNITKAEILRQMKTDQVEHIMNQSGWMDPLLKNKAHVDLNIIPKRLRTDEDKTGKEWRKVLEDKRNEILEARETEAVNNKSKNLATNTEVNEVKLVDKQYFMSKAFQASN